MPLYTYECEECGNIFDMHLRLSEIESQPACEECGGFAKRIITLGHGGIQDDHPVWLDESIRRQLQDTDDPKEKPIETRSEYNRFLKDTGIIPTN